MVVPFLKRPTAMFEIILHELANLLEKLEINHKNAQKLGKESFPFMEYQKAYYGIYPLATILNTMISRQLLTPELLERLSKAISEYSESSIGADAFRKVWQFIIHKKEE